MSDVEFPFRPWVRSTCRRAIVWGIGAVAVLGLLTWAFRTPASAPLGRAFGALVFYGFLFLATLVKIWWTAGRPAVRVAADGLGYQPLHTFTERRLPYDRILACSPKEGTQSLRILHRKGDRARELFLNLAVVKGRHRLLEELGRRLEQHGLEPVPDRHGAWERPEARRLG
ncbi:MAG: hypothetical protein R3325_04255 [Thermoanaerobaculia bacterium]|nr:hypothetical protein [Thermoanaerobaculia bacterium]